MSSVEYDFETKKKLAQSYQKEMDYQQLKNNYEKEKKLEQEKKDIYKVQQDLAAENQFLNEKKKALISLQYQDYLISQEKKRMKDIECYEDKIQQKNVSLDMKSEERLKAYRNKINTLSDKADQHAQNYSGFTHTHAPNNSSYSDIYREAYNLPLANQDNDNMQMPKSPSTLNINSDYPLNKNCDVVINYPDAKVASQINPVRNSPGLGNKTFEIYKEKNKEFERFNVDLMKQNERFKEEMAYQRKIQEEERKKEMETLMQLRYEEKQRENERKMLYRNFLDEQMKTQIPSKLANESYALTAATNAHQFNNEFLYKHAPDHYFINKNKFVEINPYCQKRYDLGHTRLENNTIINPGYNYNYNRYLFPKNSTGTARSMSALQNVGANITK